MHSDQSLKSDTANKKQHIVNILKTRLPGGGGGLTTLWINGEVSTCQAEIAGECNQHWQQVFDRKEIDSKLLEETLQEYDKKVRGHDWTIRPRHVEQVLRNPKKSSTGPDGIPFLAYTVLKDAGAKQVIFEVLQELLAQFVSLGTASYHY